MSEQKAEQMSGEQGSVRAEPAISNVAETPTEPVTASVEEAKLEQASAAPPNVPEQSSTAEPAGANAFDAAVSSAETLKAEALKATPKIDLPNFDVPKIDVPKIDVPIIDVPKTTTEKADGNADNVVTITSADRPWFEKVPDAERHTEQVAAKPGWRRYAMMAAAVVLAALTGAIGGALATRGFKPSGGNATASTASASDTTTRALQASVAKIEADVAALRISVEHNAKMGTSQLSKTSERIDKLEKAQAEPAAKLAKITEAVERLRATSPAPAAPASQTSAPKDATGTISTAAAAASPPATPPKTEVGKLPTVDGWVLRNVSHGSALIEGRQGIYEVYAGDPVPGLGRVDAIRRQDGRWVVVTSKGLIVAR